MMARRPPPPSSVALSWLVHTDPEEFAAATIATFDHDLELLEWRAIVAGDSTRELLLETLLTVIALRAHSRVLEAVAEVLELELDFRAPPARRPWWRRR